MHLRQNFHVYYVHLSLNIHTLCTDKAKYTHTLCTDKAKYTHTLCRNKAFLCFIKTFNVKKHGVLRSTSEGHLKEIFLLGWSQMYELCRRNLFRPFTGYQYELFVANTPIIIIYNPWMSRCQGLQANWAPDSWNPNVWRLPWKNEQLGPRHKIPNPKEKYHQRSKIPCPQSELRNVTDMTDVSV